MVGVAQALWGRDARCALRRRVLRGPGCGTSDSAPRGRLRTSRPSARAPMGAAAAREVTSRDRTEGGRRGVRTGQEELRAVTAGELPSGFAGTRSTTCQLPDAAHSGPLTRARLGHHRRASRSSRATAGVMTCRSRGNRYGLQSLYQSSMSTIPDIAWAQADGTRADVG